MSRLSLFKWLAVAAGFICLLLPNNLSGPTLAIWGRWQFQLADAIGLGLIVLWQILYLVGLVVLIKQRSGQPPKA